MFAKTKQKKPSVFIDFCLEMNTFGTCAISVMGCILSFRHFKFAMLYYHQKNG